jgi:hypothetical protein
MEEECYRKTSSSFKKDMAGKENHQPLAIKISKRILGS